MGLDLNGAIIKTKVLIDNVLVAEDVTISLPEVNLQTVDLKGMGAMSLPIPLTDELETTITRIGLDKGFAKALALKSMKFECRFAQNIVKQDGTTKVIGVKAFIKGVPKSIPGGDLEPGATFEGPIPIATTRYQLIVDGKEQVLVDKIQGILKINGHDYAKDVSNVI